jgi:hypothetical protein
MDSKVIGATIAALGRKATAWEWEAFLARLERLARPEQLREHWLPAQYAYVDWVLTEQRHDAQLQRDAIVLYLRRHRDFYADELAHKGLIQGPTGAQVMALEQRLAALEEETAQQARRLKAGVLRASIATEHERFARIGHPVGKEEEKEVAVDDAHTIRVLRDAEAAYDATGTPDGVAAALARQYTAEELLSVVGLGGLGLGSGQ